MRLPAAAAVAALVLAAPAGARLASTFTVTVAASGHGATVKASGVDSQTVLDGITVTATLPGGKTIIAKSYSWTWKSKGDMMAHTTTQTLTLSVQIASATGLTDCAAGTNGTVTLVDSNAKLKNGKPADSVTLGRWSAPCPEFTLAFTNAAATSKAGVAIVKTP